MTNMLIDHMAANSGCALQFASTSVSKQNEGNELMGKKTLDSQPFPKRSSMSTRILKKFSGK